MKSHKSSHACLLVVTSSTCFIPGKPESESSWADMEDLARCVRELLMQCQGRGHRVYFALESDLCLSCHFPLPASAGKLTPEAIRFAVEEYVPLAAEDFVTRLDVDDSRVFCVLAERRLVAALVSSCERSCRVIPLAFLAAYQAVAASGDTVAGERLLRIRRSRTTDLIAWDGRPVGWRLVSGGTTEAGTVMSSDLELTSGGSLIDIDLTADTGVFAFPGDRLAEKATDRQLAAYDLRQDLTMSGRQHSESDMSIRRACQVIAISALVMIGGFLYRRSELQRRISETQRVQAAVVREVISSARGPGFNRRLQSELSKRRTLARQKLTWKQQQRDSIAAFADVLTSCRFLQQTAVDRIQVSDGIAAVRVHGRSRTVDRDVQQAMEQQGLIVESEPVRPSSGLYSVDLTATRPEAAR